MPVENQIGIVRLHRPYPIKKDMYGDGHFQTIVVPSGDYPLWLNRKWPGKEVRCYPKAFLSDGNTILEFWWWSEHDVAASVMHTWIAGKAGLWDFRIDQTVVSPTWKYREFYFHRSKPDDSCIETFVWSEAVFEEPSPLVGG